MRMLASVLATFCTILRSSFIFGDSPQNISPSLRISFLISRSCLTSCRLRERRRAAWRVVTSLALSKGLMMKSNAPRLMASTARATSE